MKITSFIGLTLFLLITGCTQSALQDPYVVVLGIAQDAGVPQAGCMKAVSYTHLTLPTTPYV